VYVFQRATSGRPVTLRSSLRFCLPWPASSVSHGRPISCRHTSCSVLSRCRSDEYSPTSLDLSFFSSSYVHSFNHLALHRNSLTTSQTVSVTSHTATIFPSSRPHGGRALKDAVVCLSVCLSPAKTYQATHIDSVSTNFSHHGTLHCTYVTSRACVKCPCNGFYRAMHFSAKRGIAIACRLSVRPSVPLSVCDVREL